MDERVKIVLVMSSAAPETFVIFPLGQVTGIGIEPFTVDQRSIELLQAFLVARGIDTVVDYEHQSLTGQVAPAAGWVKKYFLKDGALCCLVRWTERAKAFIAAGEYLYFSPIVGLDKDRRLVAIHSLALTNLPVGNDLSPLMVMKVGVVGGGIGVAAGSVDLQDLRKELEMKNICSVLGLPEGSAEDKIVAAIKPLIELGVAGVSLSQDVAVALGLPAGAAAVEIMGGVKWLKSAAAAAGAAGAAVAAPVACVEVMSELGLPAGAGKSEAIAALRALKQLQVAGVSAFEFQALKQKQAVREAGDLVALALSQGKITAAQAEGWAMEYALSDPSGFELFTKLAPIVVVMGVVAAGGAGAGGKAAASPTEEDLFVRRQLGVTEEEFKKYGSPDPHYVSGR